VLGSRRLPVGLSLQSGKSPEVFLWVYCLVQRIRRFLLLKLDRGWWRFVSVTISDALMVISQVACWRALALLAPASFRLPVCARSGFLLFWLPRSSNLFRILVNAGPRCGKCYCKRVSSMGPYSGVMLLREISPVRSCRNRLRFVDDNLQKKGLSIQGIKVLGLVGPLSVLAVRHSILKYIAIPSRPVRNDSHPEPLPRCDLRCRTIPA